MRYTWIDEGAGNASNLSGFNRAPVPGEFQGNEPDINWIWGYDTDYYKIQNYAWVAKDQSDVDEVNLERSRDSALERLWEYHNSLIAEQGLSDDTTSAKKEAKLTKSLRKETKGTETPEDIATLNDNDTLDTWYDDLEVAAESQGEAWIEDPARTKEELDAFDPATDVTWPPFPL